MASVGLCHTPALCQDLARIADIKYGSLLEVDETLKKLRLGAPKSGEAMLVEQVGPEQIADVVSKWTGRVLVYICRMTRMMQHIPCKDTSLQFTHHAWEAAKLHTHQ